MKTVKSGHVRLADGLDRKEGVVRGKEESKMTRDLGS